MEKFNIEIDIKSPELSRFSLNNIEINKLFKNYTLTSFPELILTNISDTDQNIENKINSILIENCIKNKLFDKKIFENKELYRIDAEIIKKVIDKCYCENVSPEENKKMYNEIADLLKFYNY